MISLVPPKVCRYRSGALFCQLARHNFAIEAVRDAFREHNPSVLKGHQVRPRASRSLADTVVSGTCVFTKSRSRESCSCVPLSMGDFELLITYESHSRFVGYGHFGALARGWFPR